MGTEALARAGLDRLPVSLHGATAAAHEAIRDGAYRAFRRALASDAPPEVCRGCSLYRRTF